MMSGVMALLRARDLDTERIATFNKRFAAKDSENVRARFHLLLDQRYGHAERFSAAQHHDVLEAILAAHQPGLAARMKNAVVASELAELVCNPYAQVCDRGKEQAPAVPDLAMACSAAIADYLTNYIDPTAEIHSINQRLHQEHPQVMAAFEPACGLSLTGYLAGEQPEVDLFGTIHAIMQARHPADADMATDLFRDGIKGECIDAQHRIQKILIQIYGAEQAFHDLDLLKDGRHDFWTGDVASLGLLLAGEDAVDLVPLDALLADARPLGGPDHTAMPAIPRESPGTLSIARLYAVQAVARGSDGMPLAQVAVGSSVPTRNPQHFGVTAYPRGYGRVGRQTYYISEAGALWFKDLAGKPCEQIPQVPDQEGWERIAIPPGDLAARPEPLFLLVRRLDSTDPETRRKALAAIGMRGQVAKPVPPALIQRLIGFFGDADPNIVASAEMAVERLGPDAHAAGMRWVAAALAQPNLLTTQLELIPHFALDDPQLAQLLSPLLRGRAMDIRSMAAHLIGQRGERGAAAIPDLVAALADDSSEVVLEAATALDLIRASKPPAWEAVRAAASKGQISACEALIRSGDMATQSEWLLKLAQHPTDESILFVHGWIERLSGGRASESELIPLLQALTHCPIPSESAYATQLLGTIAQGHAITTKFGNQ